MALKRWQKAQQYEQSWWKKVAEKVENGAISQLDWYQWKARELEKRIEPFTGDLAIKSARALEIGSGPIGIVNFLEWGECFAIDPLEDFYKNSKTLTKLRRPEVKYNKGTGENLQFDDAFFSLVVIDNVIDHTHGPHKILQEIHRVLKQNGLLYLAVNIHTEWGAKVHRLLAALNIDKGHPHTFTRAAVRELLFNQNFKIHDEESEDYLQVKQKNCQSKSLKNKVKGYTGISEFQYHAICKNQG